MEQHGRRGRHVDLHRHGLTLGRDWRAAKYRLLRANRIRNTDERGWYELVDA
jgi:hypothetical protein